MRTVTETTNVYTIDELKELYPDGFEYAHQDYVTDGIWHEWYDYVFEDVKACAKLLGISIKNIYFTGFWSQGDGACFEGSYEYKKGATKTIKEYAPQDIELHRITKELQELQRRNFYRLSANVKHSGHYYHKMCTDINVWSDNESMGGANDDAYYGIKELLRDFMQWIYIQLEKEYDHVSSEEYFIELAQINEWEYTKDGRIK